MTEATAVEEVQLSEDTAVKLGDPLALNLYLVQVIVRSPSGESEVQNATVTKATADGGVREIDKANITTPRNRYKKFHPIWGKFDVNKRLLHERLAFYSAVSLTPSMRQVTGDSLPKLWAKLEELKAEREALVGEYIESYNDIVAGIREKLPDLDDQTATLRVIPIPDEAASKFSVAWQVWPLTPLNGEDLSSRLDLSMLNEADRRKFIEASNTSVQQMAHDQAKKIMDDVVGTMVKEMSSLADGTKLTGKNKKGALDPVITAIDRLSNFGSLLNNPTLSKKLAEQREWLAQQNADMTHLNAAPLMRQKVAETFAPLIQEIEEFKAARLAEIEPGFDRAERDLLE